MKTLYIVCLAIGLASCNTRYKNLTRTIAYLPAKKLLNTHNSNSGVTSKIDSLAIGYSISFKERLDLILTLDNKLKQTFSDYKQVKSDSNYELVVERLQELSSENDIKVNVDIHTREPGAFVRYRTQSSKESNLADNPTNNCKLNIYLGSYFIWATRGGKDTSTPQKYYILRPTSITLEEKSK